MAPGANIVAVKVLTKLTSNAYCNGQQPCIRAADVDVLDGLDWVNAHRLTYNIASANMSLGWRAASRATAI